MTEAPRRAAIYCRLSLARFGDTTKVADQERICRELAGRLGWDIAEVYTDNNVSAWKRNRRRPGWDQMLAAVESGTVTAIIVYHGDRLVRQPFDLEVLISLAEGKGIRLASPTGTRNLDNPEDRTMLRVLTAFATGESDATSRRKKAQYERMRREGLVRAGGRGGRAYGFERGGIVSVPAECEIVREAAERVLAGDPVGVICRDLTARGVKTTTGIPFSHDTLRKLLARPRYAGLMPDGISTAAWEPVLDRATWEAVRSVLSDRAAGFSYATNARRYLLSGIAVCGTCGNPVAIRHNTRSESLRGYGCISPDCPLKVHRKAEHADAHVSGFVVAILRSPEFARRMDEAGAQPDVTAEIVRLERLRDAARAQLESMSDLPATVLASAARGMAGYEEKIAAARERLAVAPGLRLARRHLGITLDDFGALLLTERRALVASLVTVTILPSRRRGPGFDPDAMLVVPRYQDP